MTTITIQFDDTTKLKKIFDFFKRLNVPFQILDTKSEPETLWESHVHAIMGINPLLSDKFNNRKAI